MGKKLRVIQVGCGPIGCSVVSLVSQRDNIELLGAVDIDPQKLGKDLGEVAGLDRKLGLTVTNQLDSLSEQPIPDIAFHTTGSSFEGVYEQIAHIVTAGVNVVSTCEELSYPYRGWPRLAEKLDSLAKTNRVSVLATGINPGFLMDAWPLSMTGVCHKVTSIKAIRIQDATSRRLPFQVKIGAGLTPAEFDERVNAGTLRHVGLPESAAMIAAGLGWKLDEVEERIEPVMAEEAVSSRFISVQSGQARGVKQVLSARRGGKDVITLEFQAYLGAPASYDAVNIVGKPNLDVIIKGGTHGDIGTAAMVVNAARRVVESPPGLLTMKDIPPVVCS